VGYTPNLVTGVWVGNADNTPMVDVIGITGAGPIWHDFMETALKPLPVEPFLPPPGLVQENVSDLTGAYPEWSGHEQDRLYQTARARTNTSPTTSLQASPAMSTGSSAARNQRCTPTNSAPIQRSGQLASRRRIAHHL